MFSVLADMGARGRGRGSGSEGCAAGRKPIDVHVLVVGEEANDVLGYQFRPSVDVLLLAAADGRGDRAVPATPAGS